MAEEIVACPGCAKKFRIPEGAASGTFPCTACGADVPYGAAAAKKPAARPAAAPVQRAAAPAPAPRPAAAAPRQAAAPARRAGAASSRRAAREEPDDQPKSSHAAIWWAIGVGGAALLTLVWWLTRPTPPSNVPPSTTSQTAKPAAKAPDKPAEKPAAAQPAAPANPAPAATAPVATAPAPSAPAETAKPDPAATEKPKTPDPVVEKKPEPAAAKPKGDVALLGQEVVSVSGTTAEERSDMDKLVTLAMDWNAGKDGVAAASKLTKMGRKAIPPVLTALGNQYKGGKWATETDQYGAYQLQQVLRDIVRSDGRPEFIAVFQPGGLAPAEDFEKAAKMWVDWWNVKGQFITKFRTSNE